MSGSAGGPSSLPDASIKAGISPTFIAPAHSPQGAPTAGSCTVNDPQRPGRLSAMTSIRPAPIDVLPPLPGPHGTKTGRTVHDPEALPGRFPRALVRDESRDRTGDPGSGDCSYLR